MRPLYLMCAAIYVADMGCVCVCVWCATDSGVGATKRNGLQRISFSMMLSLVSDVWQAMWPSHLGILLMAKLL